MTAAQVLTYPFRGLTLALINDDGAWPPDYARTVHRVLVGHGERDFSVLADGILHWQIQCGAGLRVDADTDVRLGGLVTSYFGFGWASLPIPCEVVWVRPDSPMEEGGRWCGFGYGSLTGHPESGEEAFLVRMDGNGAVYFEILAFSRPAGWLIKLGFPVAKATQRAVTTRYILAARRLLALGAAIDASSSTESGTDA